jgi:chromosome partitioning related protein ParA
VTVKVLSVVSTKGGVGKTTVTANLGGLLADAGLKVLMIDLDSQPTLSSYYPLTCAGTAGSVELIGHRLVDLDQIVSRTSVEGLHVVLSNDPLGQLNTLLLHAPDGRLRLKNLLHVFEPFYDVMLIDTQGARSVIAEMSVLICLHASMHRLVERCITLLVC